MKIDTVAMVVLGIVAAGCSNNLTEAEARRLIEGLPEYVGGVTCRVPALVPFDDRFDIDPNEVVPYLVGSDDCARALERAHMVTGVGPCNIAGQCQLVLAGPPRPEGSYLQLPCATLHVGTISGIATSGNAADFHYERELAVNAGVAEAARLCDFELPEAGSGTRDRTARRDDAGNWSLGPATH